MASREEGRKEVPSQDIFRIHPAIKGSASQPGSPDPSRAPELLLFMKPSQNLSLVRLTLFPLFRSISSSISGSRLLGGGPRPRSQGRFEIAGIRTRTGSDVLQCCCQLRHSGPYCWAVQCVRFPSGPPPEY